ncbi:MAG: citramalate synthase [Thermodesulfobacteriota bacterium]
MEKIWVYDTTLRDGTQGENINFTAEDKLRVSARMDAAGFDYIEGGWPGANPRDTKFFEMAREVSFKSSRLVAFSSTRRPGIPAYKDQNLKALAASGAKVAALFGKTWDLHVEKILGTTLSENLAMIKTSISYLQKKGMEVFYDAEHFFDGYKHNPAYAVKTLVAAAEAGARFLVLCDTNGGTMPHEVEKIVAAMAGEIGSLRLPGGKAPGIGIHAHNDCGLAVANTVAAVRAGAVMVQGTVNGYGERCGNADLTSAIPVLQAKMGYNLLPAEGLAGLRRLSRFVSEAANMIPVNNRPFVGESAFAHKGGVHVSAVMKDPVAYEHMDPAVVGNRRRVLVSDMAGKSNVEYKAREFGVDLDEKGNGWDKKKLIAEVKKMEHEGYQFDAAEGSFELLLKRKLGLFNPPFEFKTFLVTIRKEEDRPCFAEATIKISVDGKEEFTAAEGDGPVSALDNALRRALRKFYADAVDSMRLVDFKVRVIDGREGTAARVKVLIESRDRENIWNTIGVSEDIIEASWQALADSFMVPLARLNKSKKK